MEVPRLADLVKLDDSALIAWRSNARAEMECDSSAELQAVYDQTTREVVSRAADAWARS
jgi:hypothetical protein